MNRVYVVYQVEADEWIVKTATTNKDKVTEVSNRLLDELETVAIEIMWMEL